MSTLNRESIKDIFAEYESTQHIELNEKDFISANELLYLFATIKEQTDSTSEIIRDVYNSFVCSDGKKSPYDDDSIFDIVNNKGKLIKRITKHIKNTLGIKIDSNISGILGNQLKNYVIKESKEFYLDVFKVSNGIDWDDGSYGSDGSCWFNTSRGGEGSYCSSIPTFESSDNSYCLRLFNSLDSYYGYSRTWLIVHSDSVQLFNSYGIEYNVAGDIIKKILIDAGYDVKMGISKLENCHNDFIPYINNTEVLTILDKKSTLEYSYDMNLPIVWEENESEYSCELCYDGISEDDTHHMEEMCICEDCLIDNYTVCHYCQEHVNDDDINETTSDYYICDNCASSNNYVECETCNEFSQDHTIISDSTYCEDCTPENECCEDCNENFESDEMESIGDMFFCEDCKNGIDADSAREELESIGYTTENLTFAEHVQNGQQTYFTSQTVGFQNIPQSIIKAEISAYSAKFS